MKRFVPLMAVIVILLGLFLLLLFLDQNVKSSSPSPHDVAKAHLVAQGHRQENVIFTGIDYTGGPFGFLETMTFRFQAPGAAQPVLVKVHRSLFQGWQVEESAPPAP